MDVGHLPELPATEDPLPAIAAPVGAVIGVHATLVLSGLISLVCLLVVIAQPSVRAIGRTRTVAPAPA